MSKIQTLLAAATECEPSKRKDETADSPSYKKRLLTAIAGLTDDEWKKLPLEAQDWYNGTADAVEAKKEELPGWPDEEKAEEPAAGRRRGAAEPEKAKEPGKGDMVKVVTKRGRDYEGKIVELDKDGMLLDVDGKDVELDHDKIESCVAIGGGSEAAVVAEEGPSEPEVGDTVEVVTARGKKTMGVIIEIDDKVLVLKNVAGDEEEFDQDRLTSVVVKLKGAGKEKTSTGRRGTADKEPAGKEEKAGKVTKEANGGVSVTQRMRELICDNLEMTKEDLTKALKKEGLEFKDNTLALIYADSHKIVSMLRERKRIK